MNKLIKITALACIASVMAASSAYSGPMGSKNVTIKLSMVPEQSNITFTTTSRTNNTVSGTIGLNIKISAECPGLTAPVPFLCTNEFDEMVLKGPKAKQPGISTVSLANALCSRLFTAFAGNYINPAMIGTGFSAYDDSDNTFPMKFVWAAGSSVKNIKIRAPHINQAGVPNGSVKMVDYKCISNTTAAMLGTNVAIEPISSAN